MADMSIIERHEFIADISDSRRIKTRAAIEYLGPKWVGHPARRIKRGTYKEPEAIRVDLAATFARIYAAMETT